MPCNMRVKLDAILCNQHALVINVLVGFMQHRPDKSFLVNNSAAFTDVWEKKSTFCLVAGGVWNYQHLLN